MKPLIALLCLSFFLSSEVMARPATLPKPSSAEKTKISKLVRRLGELAARDASKRKSDGGGFGMSWSAGDPEVTDITAALEKYGAKVDFAVADLARYLAGKGQTVQASVDVLVSTARGGSDNALTALTKSLGSVKAEESLVAILGGSAKLEKKAEGAAPAILELFKHDAVKVRSASLKTIARIGIAKTEGAAAKILERLDDPQVSIALDACDTLRKLEIENEKVLKLFMNVADQTRNSDIDRRRAVEAIGELGARAEPALEILRTIAVNQPERVLLFPSNPIHQNALKELRIAAIESLGKLGAPARPTVPDLEKLAADPSFAAATKAALARIRASAP